MGRWCRMPDNTPFALSQIRALFGESYEAYFGPFPGTRRGQRLWIGFLDSLHDEAEVRKVIELLKADRTSGRLLYNPRLAECESALATVRGITRREGGTFDRFASACELCHGSGWMVIRARQEGQAWAQADSRTKYPAASSFCLECCCTIGEALAERRAAAGMKVVLSDVRQRARDFLLEELRARAAEPAPVPPPPPIARAPEREERPAEEEATEETEEELVASDFFVDDDEGPDPSQIPF